MRKGFDSLSGIVVSVMQCNVIGGDVFIFMNKRRNQVKLLHWEGDGFAMYHKRLEKGTYELPVPSTDQLPMTVSQQQLQLILQGILLNSVRRRKRYQHELKSSG